jgi:ribosomal 50S subunit-associated protein YjgA (DUF615 family)
MISQQTLDERKADRELFNHVRAIRRKIGKEEKGMTAHEKTLHNLNSVRQFLLENGYSLKLADGTTIP